MRLLNYLFLFFLLSLQSKAAEGLLQTKINSLSLGQQISQVLTSDGVTEYQRASSFSYFRRLQGISLGVELQWNRLKSQSGNLEISTETQRVFGVAQKVLATISENEFHQVRLFFSFAAGLVQSTLTTDFGSSSTKKTADPDLIGYAGLGFQAEMPNLKVPFSVTAELRLQSEKALSHVPFLAGQLKIGYMF